MNNKEYKEPGNGYGRELRASIWTCLFLVLIAFCLAMPSATAQQTPPIKRMPPESFAFKMGGSVDLATPVYWNHDYRKRDESIEHLVVMTPGFGRTSSYGEWLPRILSRIPKGGSVAYYVLHFLTSQDILAHGLDERYLYWSDGGWVVGDNSLNNPELPRAVSVSSFAVVDELLRRAKESFPNLKTVVIGGFSAGGQFTNRYLAANRMHEVLENEGIEVRYIVGAPSSYLYFCENRFISRDPIRFGPVKKTGDSDCEEFNTYRFGLDRMNPYMAVISPEKLAVNYASRRVDYIVGADDDARASVHLMNGCGAMLQGSHRRDRMEIYMAYLPFRFGGNVLERHRMYIIPGVGHSTRPVFDNPIGEELLFGALLSRTGDRK